jgi:hypothetical protein
MDAKTLVADQQMPVGVNGSAGDGEADFQGFPAMAGGPNNAVYVVWQASPTGQPGTPGQIQGRLVTQFGIIDPTQYPISGAVNCQQPSVVGTTQGWVVTWQDQGNIKLRVINNLGAPALPEVQVNKAPRINGIQAHPTVASIDGARFAIAWEDQGASGGTDIVVQRFDANGAPIANDQALAVNDVVTMGNQTTPSIAATTGTTGGFIVTWVDQASGHVRARYLGGSSGYLLNYVDASLHEFQASVVDGHTRANPAVTVGGAGPSVVIAWEDADPTNPGIFARKFPIPTQ